MPSTSNNPLLRNKARATRIHLLGEQSFSSDVAEISLRREQLSGDLLSDTAQVELPVVPARPVGVVVVVGLKGHPLLDLDQLRRVAENVSERPL